MIYQELKNELNAASTLDSANKIKKSWNDKHLKPLLEEIANTTDLIKKKFLGQKINEIKQQGDLIFNNNKIRFINNIEEIRDDCSVHNSNLSFISNNILSSIKEQLINFFDNLNFEIQIGNQIVNENENFNFLLIDELHPSRDSSETYYLKNKLLRTHCTSNSVKQLNKYKSEELKLITIGTVYRKDDLDARHTAQFNQLDILWVGKNLNLSNLKWLLLKMLKFIFGKNTSFRFRQSYFPFTAPSFEIDMKCKCKNNQKCSICHSSRWIEVMGCGMLHRKILENADHTNEVECIAGGVGIERLALIKYQLEDIREIYKNNFLFLKHDC